jgi:hypothetical protein
MPGTVPRGQGPASGSGGLVLRNPVAAMRVSGHGGFLPSARAPSRSPRSWHVGARDVRRRRGHRAAGGVRAGAGRRHRTAQQFAGGDLSSVSKRKLAGQAGVGQATLWPLLNGELFPRVDGVPAVRVVGEHRVTAPGRRLGHAVSKAAAASACEVPLAGLIRRGGRCRVTRTGAATCGGATETHAEQLTILDIHDGGRRPPSQGIRGGAVPCGPPAAVPRRWLPRRDRGTRRDLSSGAALQDGLGDVMTPVSLKLTAAASTPPSKAVLPSGSGAVGPPQQSRRWVVPAG